MSLLQQHRVGARDRLPAVGSSRCCPSCRLALRDGEPHQEAAGAAHPGLAARPHPGECLHDRWTVSGADRGP